MAKFRESRSNILKIVAKFSIDYFLKKLQS